MIAAAVLGLIGVASALGCLRSRQWVSAGLVLLMAAGLAGLVSDLRLPEVLPPADAPAPVSEPGLQLDFPRQLALGRRFSLTLKRSQPLASWRLQLLDENGSLLAQTSASGSEAAVSWLPPVAEAMVLQARVLDADGQLLEQGPVPLQVQDSQPLQIQGRFGAPSFDVQALGQLLLSSQAHLDWQLTLGKTVTRAETPRSPMAAPELILIDAAYFESLAGSARQALLARVGQGVPLVVLAANARDAAVWSRELQLPLAAVEPATVQADAGLELQSTSLQPRLAALSPWRAAARPGLWLRPWQQGRIVWLGLSDWHRHAISAPQQLGSWWQTVLDQAGLRQQRELQWVFPDPLPLTGQRSVVCLRGPGASGVVLEVPQAQARLQVQRRADRADDACAALWPPQAGWLRLVPANASADADADADARLAPGRLYVYDKDAWPLWQRALQRDAALVPRTPVVGPGASAPWLQWPWALLFGAAALTLWWRERR